MPGVATVTAGRAAAVTSRVIDTGGQALARRRPPRMEGTHTYSPATYMVIRRENRPLVADVRTPSQASTMVPWPGRQTMEIEVTATLKMTHKAIGVEVRRGPYDIVVDGQRAGSLEMNDTIEIPVESGRHTLQIRSGRNSSRTRAFEAAESQTVAFRCTGKSFLPIFLASFDVPSLALQLRREADDRSL